jgi:hypothetical protein
MQSTTAYGWWARRDGFDFHREIGVGWGHGSWLGGFVLEHLVSFMGGWMDGPRPGWYGSGRVLPDLALCRIKEEYKHYNVRCVCI